MMLDTPERNSSGARLPGFVALNTVLTNLCLSFSFKLMSRVGPTRGGNRALGSDHRFWSQTDMSLSSSSTIHKLCDLEQVT